MSILSLWSKCEWTLSGRHTLPIFLELIKSNFNIDGVKLVQYNWFIAIPYQSCTVLSADGINLILFQLNTRWNRNPVKYIFFTYTDTFSQRLHCVCTELSKNLSCLATTWWFTPNNYTIIKTKGLEMYLFSVFLSVTFRYFLTAIALHLYRIIEKLSYLALHQIITQLSRLKDVGSKMYHFFQFFHQLWQSHGVGKQHFFSQPH